MALEPMGLAVMPLVALLEELELLLVNGTFLSMGSAMLLLLELLLMTSGCSGVRNVSAEATGTAVVIVITVRRVAVVRIGLCYAV
jgi:hypothetical protein